MSKLVKSRVRSGDVELAVTDTGPPAAAPEAPTVVLVHGYPDTSEVWLGVLENLRSSLRVVTYDVRGAGASSGPRRRSAYRLDRLVEDLAAVIDAVSPDRPVHLVSHDWGSIQSWEAVCTNLDSSAPAHHGPGGRLASYTSISGPGIDHAAHWVRARMRRPFRNARRLIAQGMRSWYIGAFHIPGAALFWRLGGARVVHRAFRMAGELPPDAVAAPTFAKDGALGVNLYRANFVPRTLRPRERHTEVPVQLIVPLGDRYVTPALFDDHARWTKELWRRDVPGGHWIIRQAPDRVARWIGEFVDYIETRPNTEPASLRRFHDGREDPDDGKVVVVTGAGSGIGRQTALAYAERGATVVAADIDGAAAERTATLCGDLHPAPHSHHRTAVGDADAMEALAKSVERDHGGADIVVNNAGIGMGGPLLDTSVEDWERVLHVNLWGVIHGSRLFGQQMVARGEGGHIVNVASAASFTPSRAYPAYATSKAAVLMLTECLRAELANQGIGVTAICPAVVNTGIVNATRFVGVSDSEQSRRREFTNRLYSLRGFTPDRVADIIVQATERNQAVVPVMAEAKVMRVLSRLAPHLSRRIARIDPLSPMSSSSSAGSS